MKKDYTLEKIAQELKITKKETGLFDPSLAPETLEIPQGILSLILNQKIDVLSPLIAYGKSSYLCVLKEKTTTRIPLLSEIKTKVKDTLTKEITKKTAEAKINNCAEKLKKLEFSQAANTCGLKAKLSPYFKSSGQIPELGSSNIFWENAKKLKTNQVSPILSDANGFYIIKLNALKPLDEEKFNKEKTDFGQKLLQQKQNAEFSKFLDEAKKKAQ